MTSGYGHYLTYRAELVGRTGTTRHGERVRCTGPALDPMRATVIPIWDSPAGLESFTPQVRHVDWDAPVATCAVAAERAPISAILTALVGLAIVALGLLWSGVSLLGAESASCMALLATPALGAGDKITARLFGQYLTLQRCEWQQLLAGGWDDHERRQAPLQRTLRASAIARSGQARRRTYESAKVCQKALCESVGRPYGSMDRLSRGCERPRGRGYAVLASSLARE